MKKTLIFRSMLIAAMLVTSSALMAQKKYAVLICGGSDNSIPVPAAQQYNQGQQSFSERNAEFWNDTYLMWELLQKEGYTEADIHVLFRDGKDYYKHFEWYPTRYMPNYEETIVTDQAATYTNVVNTFTHLASVVKPEDSVLVALFDNEGTAQLYKKESINTSQVNSLLQNILATQKSLLTHTDMHAYLKQGLKI